jgi:hypothetical protein
MLGAIIIALGALAGIWLGAYYAAGRLSIQLEQQNRWFAEQRAEDSQHLQRQLEAEATRLERQLEHDRKMRDRDSLRMTLDEGAVLINEAVDSLHWLASRTQGEVPEDEEELEELEAARRETIDDLYDKVGNGFSQFWQRLLVRFPAEHSIPKAIRDTRERIATARDLYEIDLSQLTEEREQEYQAAVEEVAKAHTSYLVECRDLIGVD